MLLMWLIYSSIHTQTSNWMNKQTECVCLFVCFFIVVGWSWNNLYMFLRKKKLNINFIDRILCVRCCFFLDTIILFGICWIVKINTIRICNEKKVKESFKNQLKLKSILWRKKNQILNIPQIHSDWSDFAYQSLFNLFHQEYCYFISASI